MNKKHPQRHPSTASKAVHRHSHVHDAPTWFEQPANINRMIYGLVGVCILLVVFDLFYTNPHPHFAIETSIGFQAWFGFLAFVIIVFLGRMLRLIVSRPEDYYDR